MNQINKEQTTITEYKIENWISSNLAMYFILTLIILLAYGYEIFNFNLSIDDEINIHSIPEDAFLTWLSQSRWGMSLLSYIVLPYPIVPVVSIALGVSGIAIGILIILKSMFDIDRVGILFITALAATIPIFLFILVFNANAYGIGFGYIAIAIGSLLIHNKNVSSLILACLLAAFAIGTYQTFIFVLAIIMITQIWYFNIQTENKFLSLHHTMYPVLFFIGSIIIYIIVNFTLQWFFSIKDQYITSITDITGFINNPLKKLSFAYYQMLDIINLKPEFFGIQSIWLKITLLMSLAVMCINLFRQFNFTIKITITSAIILFITIFSLMLTNRIILRALVHIPFSIAIILAYSYTLSGNYIKPIFIIIYALTIIGNASINNHLFASATSAEFQDKMLAHTIINEVRRLKPENTQNIVYKLVMIGYHSWPVTAIQSKTDTFGASFFEWNNGNVYRVAYYLRLNGLNIFALQNVAQSHLDTYIEDMPIWPKTGWVSIVNDDIVILKFDNGLVQKKVAKPQFFDMDCFNIQKAIRLNNKDTACSYILMNGWNQLESWGVWSNANAEMQIDLPNECQNTNTCDLKLFLPMGIYNASATKPKEVVIKINAQLIEKISIGEQKTITIPLDYKILQGQTKNIKIQFSITDAESPGSSDARILGMALDAYQLIKRNAN